MSMSVVIHMATYLRPRHVLGILIGSQKQETFLSLPFCLSLPSPCATCSPQGRRRAGQRVQREYRELGTETGAVHIVRLLPVFLRILVYFFFFLLLLLLPGANYDSTSRLQAKRLGQEVMHMSGSLGVRRKICQWRRQPPSGRQQAGRQHSFMLHANFPCTHSKTLLPIPAAPPTLHPPLNRALVLRHCLSSLLAYFAYFAIQFLFFICAFFQPSLSLFLSLPLSLHFKFCCCCCCCSRKPEAVVEANRTGNFLQVSQAKPSQAQSPKPKRVPNLKPPKNKFLRARRT